MGPQHLLLVPFPVAVSLGQTGAHVGYPPSRLSPATLALTPVHAQAPSAQQPLVQSPLASPNLSSVWDAGSANTHRHKLLSCVLLGLAPQHLVAVQHAPLQANGMGAS